MASCFKLHKKNNSIKKINRRQFIKDAGFLTAGAVGSFYSVARGSQPVVAGKSVPGKMTYRRLGRTGLDISVVVAGEMDLVPMHERAYELGVNYWHKVGNFEHLEEDIAVGFEEKMLSVAETETNNTAIRNLAEDLSTDYCRSCGRCKSVCPKQIEVADIFRFEMYHSAYGTPQKARRLYGELPSTQRAVACDACGSCEEVCPHGLSIISKLQAAHTMLSQP